MSQRIRHKYRLLHPAKPDIPLEGKIVFTYMIAEFSKLYIMSADIEAVYLKSH